MLGFVRNDAAALVYAVLVALAAPSGAAAAEPHRIVSIALCADQLVLALADRDQIAAVSWLAGDAHQSFMAQAAKGLPITYGTAEEVVALRPDLVLASAYAARPTVALLRRLGIRVLDLGLPRSFADIARETARVAAAVGHPERGRKLVADMHGRLAAAAPPSGARRPVAVLYQPGGVTMGQGFLEDRILVRAGFVNLADRLGIAGPGTIGLEQLVAAKPDLIAFGARPDGAPSLATRLFRHPAIREAVPGARRVVLPPPLWTCGAWFTARAVGILAAARRGIGQ